MNTGKPCLDCGQPTRQPRSKSEWYMVHDRIWVQCGAPVRTRISQPGCYLCIGCLEIRLGRELVAADFTGAPVNATRDSNTKRLNDRLTTRQEETRP